MDTQTATTQSTTQTATQTQTANAGNAQGQTQIQSTGASGNNASGLAEGQQQSNSQASSDQVGQSSQNQQTQATQGDQQTQTQTQTAQEFRLPDEHKDKPWAAKVKSQDDLYKQIDNLTALVGKKSLVPDLATATPEEREAFYAQTRPKDAAEYKFTDGIPVDPTMDTGVRELLSKNGISATQGNEIIKGFQKMEQDLLAQQFTPEGMKQAMETAFGADWQKITGQTRNVLKGVMNQEDQTALDHLPNLYAALIYRTLGNIVKAYGVKETGAHTQAGVAAAASDIGSIRQGLRDQLSALSGRVHTAQEAMELRQKLADTYKNDPRLAQGG